MKRYLSFVLALMIILGGLPVCNTVVYAADGEPVFTGITVTKVFRDTYGAEKYSILINGQNFIKDGNNLVEVGIMSDDGTIRSFSPVYKSPVLVQYELKPNEISNQVYINGYRLDISETDIPNITNKTPTAGIVDGNGEAEVTLVGSKFHNITSRKVEASLFQGNTDLPITEVEADNKIKSAALKGKTGIWSVQFKKTSSVNIGNSTNVMFIIQHRYLDIFTVLNKLNVSDKVELIPTQGTAESIVTLKGDSLKPVNEMSVFFLKSLDNKYASANLGTGENYRRDEKEQRDIFAVKVPKGLSVGSYYVVLTNNVDPAKDIKDQIKSYKVLDTKFTVIDRKNSVSLDSITPGKGPAKGIDAVVKGINIGRISSAIYESGTRSEPDITTNSSKMSIEYTGGKYKLIGENGVQVKKLTREITIHVGGPVRFREGSDFNKDTFDYINIRVEENNDNQKLVKEIIVEITTRITYIENGVEKIAEIVETDTLKNGFTYEPLDYIPKITSIVPDRIPVNNENKVLPGLKLSIIGENFLLYRYMDKDGNIRYKYPKIDLGGQRVLDPNNEKIEIKVFDKSGREIDGTANNDIGSKILITIPRDVLVKEDIINNPVDLRVTNPIRSPDSNDEGSSATGKIIFARPAYDRTPVITSIIPNTVTIDGEKGIKIIGQNFGQNASLFINGVKISGIKRNGTGTEITFDAPPNNEGYVQIVVQNEEGGIAIYNDFLYVKTYTSPKFIDFNPKKGTANTLVNVKGENFVPPNPLVKDLEGIGIIKLIGTRIMLGGEDVNSYNLGKDGRTIELQPYNTPAANPLFQNNGGLLKLADYYYSVILEDEKTTAYYKIYFDAKTGKTLLTDGYKEVYELYVKDNKENKFYGKKVGETETELKINSEPDTGSTESIEIDSIILNIRTPYEIEKVNGIDTITGNRVKVINSNELIFKVPSKQREGYYDLAIVNPDTKKDEKKGEQGFYYSFHPNDPPPFIEKIEPDEGSVDGQYYINIIGRNFIDRGSNDQKSQVIIGGIAVDPKDVEGSPDGKILTVKAPKYPGDLAKETDMDRKTVPVIVVNPDGGSDSKEDGFTYVVPISHPKITKLILDRGSAAGGELVTIEGSDFRFFEPYRDLNNNSQWDYGEPFTDLNNNEKWDDLRYWLSPKLKEEYDSLAENLITPILPKIYFNGKPAKVKGFTAATIEVETPKGVKGPAEVYLVNNDYGVSNKVTFTYEATNPKIRKIVPNTGKKQGGDKIEILGEYFFESRIKVYTSEKKIADKNMPLIQFGSKNDANISNKEVPIELPNSGRIKDKFAEVKVGNLTVSYSAAEDIRKLSFIIEENKEKFMLNDVNYDDTEAFLPVNLLKNSKDESYNGYEYVRIRLERITGAVSTNRLRIDRGFSPEAVLQNIGQILIRTPSYYTVGATPVIVSNPDGGEASGEFIYKNPNSKPVITNILKDGEQGKLEDGKKIIKVNYKGGNLVDVLGLDFRRPVTIKIGDVVEIKQGIEYSPANEAISNKLTFKMPAVAEKYVNNVYRLVAENEDGGVAGSDEAATPIYIQIIKGESDGLAITKVTPNTGPAAGGTLVTIEGKDFRSKMDGFPDGKFSVYFGDGKNQVRIRNENIVSIATNKIQLRTPAYSYGTVPIKVENPDGNMAELANAFTYISNPEISYIADPENGDIVINVISVEGGRKIKIVGNDFMPGARIIFNPVIRNIRNEQNATGEVIIIDTEKYVLESGNNGTEVEVINGQVITVVVPPGKIDTKGVMVINPDKGASPIYNIAYGIPEIGAPQNVRAEIAYDQYIKVSWKGVTGAEEYELYVSEEGKNFEYIGSTELLNYVYKKIKPTTTYKFMVRAFGKYGSSKPLYASRSNLVKTGPGVVPNNNDGELAEKTTIQRMGNTVNVVIGFGDYRNLYDADLVIDITKGSLAGSAEVIVSIPASIVVNDRNKSIAIVGKDYKVKFKPSVFKSLSMTENENRDDAGVKFKISTYKGSIELNNNDMTVLSNKYILEAYTFAGADSTAVDHLNDNMELDLDYDGRKSIARGMKRIYTARYEGRSNVWEKLPYSSPYAGSTEIIDRMGIYAIIGRK
ncbi:MAG TPA: IPT/TIG domain-containing protein [Clostridiales bacterium]|nr:IPT/TIG domain-containing protein [Clostridiales bacterium]